MNEPAASQFAIEIDGLECRYGDRVVLENVSFAVKRGEIFFIIGGRYPYGKTIGRENRCKLGIFFCCQCFIWDQVEGFPKLLQEGMIDRHFGNQRFPRPRRRAD